MRTIPLLVVLLVGCASTSPASESEDVAAPGGDESKTAPAPAPSSPTNAGRAPAPAPAKPSDLAFRVLTYNVAGLPEGVSKSNPAANHR